MKLLLHIGHTKTGTTSIQGFCARHRHTLLQRGILYPWTVHGRDHHTLLPAGFVRDGTVEPSPHGVFFDDYDAFKRSYAQFWLELKKDIARFKPKILILSAEQLFKNFAPLSHRDFRNLLSELTEDVEVVAYLRHPVDDLQSRIAQRVKRGRLIPNLHRPVRQVLEYYESLYPGHIHPNLFLTEAMHGGDVVDDFVHKFLPQATDLLSTPRNRRNESLPAALLFLLEKIRTQSQPNQVDRASEQAFLQIQAANQAFHRLGLHKRYPEKLQLRDEVVRHIVAEAGDFLWLRERYGLVFPDLAYESIRPSTHAPKPQFWTLSELAHVPGVDFDQLGLQISRSRPKAYLLAAHHLIRLAVKVRDRIARLRQQYLLARMMSKL